MNTVTEPSIDEKVAKYKDINGLDDSTLNSGYLDFKPINTATQNKIDLPTIDYSSMAQNNPIISPLLISPNKSIDKTTDNVKVDPTNKSIISKTMSTKPTNVYTPNKAAQDAYSYYVNQKGLPTHVAAGIVGNLYRESGVDPTRHQNDGGPGRGLAQWTEGDRWKTFQNWSVKNNKNPLDLHTQLDYILIEPGQEGAIKRTLAAKDAAGAAMAFGRYFERPAEATAGYDERVGIANALMNNKI